MESLSNFSAATSISSIFSWLNVYRREFCWASGFCFSISHSYTRSHLGASQYNHSLLVLLLTLMGIKCLAEGYLDGSCWIQSISHLFSLITLSQHFSQHTHLLKLHKLGSYNFHTGFRPSIFQIIPQIRLFLFLSFFFKEALNLHFS